MAHTISQRVDQKWADASGKPIKETNQTNHVQASAGPSTPLLPPPPPLPPPSPRPTITVELAERLYARRETKSGVARLQKGVLKALATNRLKFTAEMTEKLNRKEIAELLHADVSSQHHWVT